MTTTILTCRRSGLPLASVTALCSSGWPLLGHATFKELIHPVYDFSMHKLLDRFKRQLDDAAAAEYMIIDNELSELGLTMSAVMYALDAFWQPSREAALKQAPSLPCHAVVIGCGARLLTLASGLHQLTSHDIGLPLYRVSLANANLKWENFKSWLDSAFEIKQDWEEGKQDWQDEETLRVRSDALHSVTAASVHKRIDFAKVWNWIDIQLIQDGRYGPGRRATFKTVFMSGDSKPEDWTQDDVEDIQLAIVECCDVGNEINFFINTRLEHIKAGIQDFYSSFTLLTHSSTDIATQLDMTEEETAKSSAFFAGFDKRVDELTELPPTPVRTSYASLGLFLQAQAQHNILSKRYDMAKKATIGGTS